MHKPESILENETHNILWDFEIKTDHPIPARRPHLVLINKKGNWSTIRLCSSSRSLGEDEGKLKDRQIPGPCKTTEKDVEYEGQSDTNCNW